MIPDHSWGDDSRRHPTREVLLDNQNIMEHKLLGDRALLEVIEGETKTASGLLLNVETSPDDARTGKVVAVGTGKDTDQGHVDVKVAVGDTVMFQYGRETTVDGKKYFLVNADDLIMIMK